MKNPFGLNSLAALVVASAATCPALAVELEWKAPPECPIRDAVERDVARLAGPLEDKAFAAQLLVTRTPDDRWRVTIALTGAVQGHRELTADNCAQLARAAALIIALAANPDATLNLPTEELGGLGEEPTVGPSLPPPISSHQTEGQSGSPGDGASAREDRRSARREEFGIGPIAGLGYDSGSLPLGAGFLSLGLSARSGQFFGSLAGDVSQSARAQFADGLGAKFRVTGVELVGCVEPLPLAIRPSICLGPRVDALLATGYGATANFSRRVIRPAGVVGAHLNYDLSSRLEIGVRADLWSSCGAHASS
ncbi:MAG: hypothetical protein QM784_08635 [Polyangiaceae bacterium]